MDDTNHGRNVEGRGAHDVGKLMQMPNLTFSTLKKLGVVSKLVTSQSALTKANDGSEDSSRLFRRLQNTFTNRLKDPEQ